MVTIDSAHFFKLFAILIPIILFPEFAALLAARSHVRQNKFLELSLPLGRLAVRGVEQADGRSSALSVQITGAEMRWL